MFYTPVAFPLEQPTEIITMRKKIKKQQDKMLTLTFECLILWRNVEEISTQTDIIDPYVFKNYYNDLWFPPTMILEPPTVYLVEQEVLAG
jgi:hypothetical protein